MCDVRNKFQHICPKFSHLEVFSKKNVLRNFEKFTRKRMPWSTRFYLKNKFISGCFCSELCERF